ncbi:unnamed protein product, partial [marine sediment metagenome]
MLPLGFFGGLLGWDLPDWFISFVIILGFVFMGLGQNMKQGIRE